MAAQGLTAKLRETDTNLRKIGKVPMLPCDEKLFGGFFRRFTRIRGK